MIHQHYQLLEIHRPVSDESDDTYIYEDLFEEDFTDVAERRGPQTTTYGYYCLICTTKTVLFAPVQKFGRNGVICCLRSDYGWFKSIT